LEYLFIGERIKIRGYKKMKNILYAMIAVLLLGVGLVSATVNPCDPDNPAYVTGTVYDQADNTVAGASVTVDCSTQTGETVTDLNGNYMICFDADVCTYNTPLYAEASKDGVGSGENNDETMCDEEECFVPIGIVDITIPEFGVIAGAFALVGALGIFMFRRK
jgi:hypothetical protein